MEALSQALEDVGVRATLVEPVEPVEDALVVVDSYRLRADKREWFQGPVVAAVDDLRRDLAVDLVVDPSPGSCRAWHPSARRVLSGSRYAPLDPLIARAATRPPGIEVQRVLIATGGSDTGAGVQIAAELTQLLGPAVQVRLVVGPDSPVDAVDGVEIVRTTSGLVHELAASDLVVTAAGVTMLEALALGRPTVAFVLVENQRPNAEGAAHAGAALVSDLPGISAAAAALTRDPDRRRALSLAARSLVDGHGAQRVADELLALV
jgi:spore coat polysaccharide biosynthesis predicted glycosyltransferase SpsG